MQIASRPHLHILEFDPDTAKVQAECPLCGDKRTLEAIDFNALHNWVTGGSLIQRAFPNLSASDREALQTGICDDCWDTMGGDA